MIYKLATDNFEFSFIAMANANQTALDNHCHSRYEMILVVEGDITIKLENKIYSLTANQCIIIPPLQYHTIEVNDLSAYKRITTLFELSAIPSILQSTLASNSFRTAPSYFSQTEKLKSIFLESNPSYYAPLAESLMTQIFYDSIQATEDFCETKSDKFLQSAINYIDKHIYEKILLDQLAKHMLCSKSAFCHLFEQKMNISPKQYILQKKLAIANKLIKEGTPISDVALKLGYENYSNFYRVYLKQYGISPADYKNKRNQN